MRRVLLAALLMGPALGHAETLYVIDRLVVGLRAEPVEGAPPVKSVETGTALEVLERQENLVRVREPQGAEGWIDGRYLTAQAPARTQVQTLQAELSRVRAQLAKAQAQPPSGDPTAAAGIERLEAELTNTRAQLAAAQAQVKQAQQAPSPRADAPPAPANRFRVLWLVIGFAMLGLGFAAGVIWVRESIRRRMGGMYLRM